MPDSRINVLTDIATSIIVAELKRRAVAAGKTSVELLAEAEAEWKSDDTAVDDLANKGHE